MSLVRLLPSSHLPPPPPVPVLWASSFLRGRRHLEEAVLVEAEQPPALRLGEVVGAPSLVELDGRVVALGDDEVHAAATSLHRQLSGRRGRGNGEGKLQPAWVFYFIVVYNSYSYKIKTINIVIHQLYTVTMVSLILFHQYCIQLFLHQYLQIMCLNERQ